MLVGASLAWGLTWPALRIALDGIPPFSMRVGTCVIGASALFAFGFLQHRELRIRAADRLHVIIAGCLNVAGFAPRIHEGMDRGAVGPGKLLGKRTPANEPATTDRLRQLRARSSAEISTKS